MDATFATVDDVMAHFGVKGMKWGVRKSPEQKDAKRVRKEDERFERAAVNPHTHTNLWMQSVRTLKKSGDLDRLNKKPEYAASKMRLRLGVANRELQQKYEDEVAGQLMNHIKKNASEIVNRSGTRRFDIDQAYRATGKKGQKVLRESRSVWRIVTVDIKQAVDDESLVLRVVRDEVGRIIDFIPEETTLQQDSGFDDVMAHFGVKGMKWGVRKTRPISDDAKQKAAIKDAVKSNKVSSVSNKQLMEAITRMRLEQDYKRLAVNEKSAASRWVSSMMLELGKREVQQAAGKVVTGALVKKLATGGLA